MMRFLIVSMALVSIGLSALPTCPTYDACNNPVTDLSQKLACYLVPTSLVSLSVSQKLMGKIAIQICNGSTLTDITNNFMSTAQSCLPLASYSTVLSVASAYSNAVKAAPCNSTISAQMTIVGTQFKNILGPMLTSVQNILAPYKGQCTSAAVYPAFAKYSCQQGTAALIQKLITAIKTAQKENCWPAAPKTLSPKALLLTKYTI